MKIFEKKLNTVVGLCLLMGIGMFFPLESEAQRPPDSNTEIFTDPDLPLDGGVGLLIAAGVAYGAKKVRDERKKKRPAGL